MATQWGPKEGLLLIAHLLSLSIGVELTVRSANRVNQQHLEDVHPILFADHWAHRSIFHAWRRVPPPFSEIVIHV